MIKLLLKNKKSFTLIETIVVVTIVGLIIPLIFVIIFSLARQQLKIFRLSRVKREGDYISNTISTLIKNNALSVHFAGPPTDANEKCKIIESFTSSNYRLIFKDKREDWFRILWATDKISSYSSVTAASKDLNSDNIAISNFTIGCDRASLYSPAIISISFDVCYKTSNGTCVGSTPEETANLHYQSKIKLRNF